MKQTPDPEVILRPNNQNKTMETKKRLTQDEKKQKLVEDLINKMFELAGHEVTYDDVKNRKDDWYTQWTMTTAQSVEWRKWGETEVKRVFKYNKKTCAKEMAWINLMWGLKYSDFKIDKT